MILAARCAPDGWRATFYTTGMEHSPTSATGTAWERTPWRATQRAAWALKRAEAAFVAHAPRARARMVPRVAQVVGLGIVVSRR